MRKSDVLEIVNELADDADVAIDRLFYTLYVRREIDRRLADADAGREVSFEEIDLMIEAWPD